MKINIISFNIRCCDDPNGNSVFERAPRLKEIISRYPADIIGFQEYNKKWQPYITDYYGGQFEIFNKWRTENPKEIESTPILWKKDAFECVKTGFFWLSDTPEVESRGWDELYNCHRMCVYVILKDKNSGKAFTVMNTHFGFGDKGQVKSADLVYEYSKKASQFPTVIIGDFNMTSQKSAYAAMTENFIDVNAVTARDECTTYHGYKPDTVNDKRIDFCFVDKSVSPIDMKTIKDTVDGNYPSDHYGLYVNLDI